MKLRPNRSHASAQQLEPVLVDSEGTNMHLPTCVDEVLAQCEVYQAFEKAARIPAAGTSTVAMFNEELQVDLLLLGGSMALHVMDVFSIFSLLLPVRTKNPQEVWAAFCGPWVGVSGLPSSIRVGEGGEWMDEFWTDLRSERRIKSFSQCVGAHPLDF